MVAEVDSRQHEIDSYEQKITDYEQLNKTLKKIDDKSVVIANGKFIESEANNYANDSIVHSKDSVALEKEVTNLKNDITELKVQVKVERWQKEEIDSQLQDVIQENQLLHQKVAELNKEILDWESFAQKEECYRRIAEAFTIKHNIEVEETFIRTAHCNGGLSLSPSTLSLYKARSCEFLNSIPGKEEALPTIIKGSELRKSIQSSLVQSNSLLSELDKEYDVLVKRYEALLEKCTQDRKYNENPERTRKVQRAIQTLSLDFSKLTTPIQSPIKPSKSLTSDEYRTTTTTTSCLTETQHHSADFRSLFSQIFAKLKEAPVSDESVE